LDCRWREIDDNTMYNVQLLSEAYFCIVDIHFILITDSHIVKREPIRSVVRNYTQYTVSSIIFRMHKLCTHLRNSFLFHPCFLSFSVRDQKILLSYRYMNGKNNEFKNVVDIVRYKVFHATSTHV
jgi:hypothetical protein